MATQLQPPQINGGSTKKKRKKKKKKKKKTPPFTPPPARSSPSSQPQEKEGGPKKKKKNTSLHPPGQQLHFLQCLPGRTICPTRFRRSIKMRNCPTVRAGSAGELKRGTSSDGQTHCCNYIRDEEGGPRCHPPCVLFCSACCSRKKMGAAMAPLVLFWQNLLKEEDAAPCYFWQHFGGVAMPPLVFFYAVFTAAGRRWGPPCVLLCSVCCSRKKMGPALCFFCSACWRGRRWRPRWPPLRFLFWQNLLKEEDAPPSYFWQHLFQ